MRMYWCNKRGAGKTLSVCNDAIEYMLYSYRNIIEFYDKVDYYNGFGFKFSKKFEHLGFANFDINASGTEIPFLSSYKVNPFKLGLYSKNFKTDLFPSGAIFFITEFQNYCDSDMYQYLRPEVKTFYQTSRHYGLDFVVDCQRPTDIAKKIRDLFDEFYECWAMEEIIKNDICVAVKMTYRVIRSGRVLEEYLKTNDEKLCEIVTKIIPCRYNNYDSYFCELLHIKGREKQDYKIVHFGEEDDSDIFTEVKGYYLPKKERTKKESEEELL